MKPFIVASTRPEIIKLSPVMREFDRRGIKYIFAATGQHYDESLFEKFIRDLKLRNPDYNIKVGSGSQAYQTSAAMVGLEKLMLKEKPDVVVIEGDTNSVLSAALAAAKLHIPVAHVEAGLRSYDKKMPEEINRIVADHCSELLFAPTEEAGVNLINEGIFPEKIFITGNTIVDATFQNLKLAGRSKFKNYIMLTLHRAENVDDFKVLSGIVEALTKTEENIVFPVHPRTKKMLRKFNLLKMLTNITILEPLGYLDFLALLEGAKIVLTDSGGVQEECIILHVPCITLRTTTERPETVEAGGNILAGIEPKDILEKLGLVLADKKLYKKMKRAKNPFGDGKAANRIVNVLLEKYRKRELRTKSPNFVNGFWRRKFIKVDSELDGIKIKNLNFTVLKIIENGTVRFPHKNETLKSGQLLEVLYR